MLYKGNLLYAVFFVSQQKDYILCSLLIKQNIFKPWAEQRLQNMCMHSRYSIRSVIWILNQVKALRLCVRIAKELLYFLFVGDEGRNLKKTQAAYFLLSVI